MKALDTNLPSASRRGPVRMDTQDGPWSVSVAETPYDSNSYSLYIKTPTHNLTLTRTAMEIVELDLKLRNTHSNTRIPLLPINPDTLPIPPKRKSTFLNTLSRLASPTSARSQRQANNTRKVQNTTTIASPTTPLITPSKESSDPFGSFTSSNGDLAASGESSGNEIFLTHSTNQACPSPTPTVASNLAAYFTTLANIPSLRLDRYWQRFVHVRTDDLESVRVERAIKRVRSDLGVHLGIPSKEKENTKSGTTSIGVSSVEVTEAASITEKDLEQVSSHPVDHGDAIASWKQGAGIKEGENEGHPSQAHNATDSTILQPPPADNEEIPQHTNDVGSTDPPANADGEDGPDVVPHTPLASDHPSSTSRMHRSQSADPDRSHRLSRAYTTSVPSQNGADSQTGDESSSSAAALVNSKRSRRRKKRSMSRSTPKDREPKKSQRKVAIDDFEMMRVLGKGCAGKVLLVRHKMTQDLFALKAITKRHVLAHQELQHTLTEQAVLKRMAAESRDPFVVKLWWSFHDKENLFLVMDFHPGGDLATQLARWGRLGRDRARFYAAEIVEGVEGLHAAGVIYRDLKPENILIGGDGHIVLTDFGLSKEFPRYRNSDIPPSESRGGEFYSSVPGTPQPVTPPWMKAERNGEIALGWPGQPIGILDSTSTFCGTAEYLAPEVIQGLSYSYEVDWWSFGTMLFEMLTGITPFWADNHSDMYVRVLQDELQFPDDRAIDHDTKSLIRGLLQRIPSLRICEPRIKRHPYFSMIDWSHVYYKRYIPPYIPPIDPLNASDTQNFDDTFLDMAPVLDDFNENEATDTDQEPQTDADRTDGEETNTTPSQSRSSSIRPQPQPPVVEDVDVFDGYSFKGRHSVLIDDEEDEASEDSDEGSFERGMDEQSSIVTRVEGTLQPDEGLQDEVPEPKTPEARPPPVLPVTPEPEPVTPIEKHVEQDIVLQPPGPQPEPEPEILPTTRTNEEFVPPPPSEPIVPFTGRVTPPPPPPKAAPLPPRQPTTNRPARSRREKSGVPALDRYLSDAVDEDGEATEADREGDEDWDFIDSVDGEDRNGTKGTSLFARGVVDRYRLAVFRKASTPNSSAKRSTSGLSATSGANVSEIDSPSPSKRRGRTAGLPFRKRPREFLRPKSPPPSSYSAKTARSISSQSASNSNTLSAASTSSVSGLLTSSLSAGSTLQHSLKSKESAMSVGAQSHSSDQSVNGQSPVFIEMADTLRMTPQMNGDAKHKNKKLRKYKNNAEKVFSLFSSPRQAAP